MAWHILSHPKLWHVAFQVGRNPPPKKNQEGALGLHFLKNYAFLIRIPRTVRSMRYAYACRIRVRVPHMLVASHAKLWQIALAYASCIAR